MTYKELTNEFFDLLLKTNIPISPIHYGGKIVGNRVSFEFSENEYPIKYGGKRYVAQLDILVDGTPFTAFKSSFDAVEQDEITEKDRAETIQRLREDVCIRILFSGVYNFLDWSQKLKAID